MAAIDLELGLECGGRGWGQERPDTADNFDSEMQEWEDQLQDIQRKIEELYNEVQARRGANDITGDNQKNGDPSDCELRQHSNVLFAPGSHGGNRVRGHDGHGCSCCRSNGVSEIGDFLQDYLEKGNKTSRKNNRARHVHFSDTVKVNQDISAFQDEARRRSGNHRVGPDQYLSTFEETENIKNRVSHMRGSPHREENTGAKPPVGQRDASAASARSQFPVLTTESPLLDKKSFTPGVLGDRKCSSPSVLRKFGAMLQENEGKTLTESGVVTHQGPSSEAKCPTPCCQRRALGATGGASKAPMRMPNQKCQANSDVLTAETEPSQDRGSLLESARHHFKDQREVCSSAKGSQSAPQQILGRSQVPGSPKVRPRANSGADREGGRARKQQLEPKTDYRTTSPSGAHRIPRRQDVHDSFYLRDEGLIELLDMLDIQHDYSSSPRVTNTAYRQEPQQVNPAEMSPARPKRSFSRPARPANQRPPSRWANRTPTARISAPSGPIYRPPSPLTRTPSPGLKHRPPVSYSLQTETIIM
ncbi:protein piccolo-like [Gambusia affinis]|uniref:protein piccolo-like n=1 Tax=Gambusia affinis TaxID=33528 RepID=UPI001CDCABFC|nr:protein piccolo-like [Gambusia affinis]